MDGPEYFPTVTEGRYSQTNVLLNKSIDRFCSRSRGFSRKRVRTRQFGKRIFCFIESLAARQKGNRRGEDGPFEAAVLPPTALRPKTAAAAARGQRRRRSEWWLFVFFVSFPSFASENLPTLRLGSSRQKECMPFPLSALFSFFSPIETLILCYRFNLLKRCGMKRIFYRNINLE